MEKFLSLESDSLEHSVLFSGDIQTRTKLTLDLRPGEDDFTLHVFQEVLCPDAAGMSMW